MRVSRAKVENIICLSINTINSVVYVLVFAAAIAKATEGTLGEIIMSVYGIIMSILLIVNEIKTFAVAQAYFGFLGFHAGRGLLFCFLGCLVMSSRLFNVIVSIITCTVGLGYLIVSFLPHMPPPNAFCVHWQHHQDFWAEGLDLPGSGCAAAAPHMPAMKGSTAAGAAALPLPPPHPSTWHPKVRY